MNAGRPKALKKTRCDFCRHDYADINNHILNCSYNPENKKGKFKPASELMDAKPEDKTPPPVPEDTPVCTKTLDEIESEMSKADAIANPAAGQSGEPPKKPFEPDKSVKLNAEDVVLIRDIYGFVSSILNDKFNTKDFPNDDTPEGKIRLDKLERITLKTFEYYHMTITPPVALIMVIGFAYVLPFLKHAGILDSLKEKWNTLKGKSKKPSDKKEDVKT